MVVAGEAMRLVSGRSRLGDRPLACVIGDLSLVRALGRRRIPVVLVSNEPAPNASLSRYCLDVIQTPSWVEDPAGAVAALVEWSRLQADPPVLFYQGDHDLLAVSRARARLAPHMRFVLPDAELVDTLVDKIRFADLANERDLPVPTTRALRAGPFLASQIKNWDDFPCVLKPATRSPRFRAIGNDQKAIRIEDRAMLDRTMSALRPEDGPFVLQAAIEGGEDQIVSYHAYVRPGGDLVAQFTGRKVRTAPRLYGYSSYIEITEDPEVHALGRQVLEVIAFSGVAKVDFKRDARDGRLYLLEINPRFNLWHHPATVAGVCIPELVYRDAIDPGSAPRARVTKPGVRWVSMRDDLWAMRQYRAAGELSLGEWAAQMTTVDVNESFDLRDPVPGLVAFGKYFTQFMRRRMRGLLPAPARLTGEAHA